MNEILSVPTNKIRIPYAQMRKVIPMEVEARKDDDINVIFPLKKISKGYDLLGFPVELMILMRKGIIK